MTMTRREFAAVAGILLTPVVRSGESSGSGGAIVEVEHGRLRGLRANGAVSFKGIPYAADTGGRNRFMAPQPVASWAGVREALRFGDRCPQRRAPAAAGANADASYSENCCVLNVYTPDLSSNARRPVLVYFHGGGFSSGSGDSPSLDGSNLANFANAVIVTVNHRLNVFGYTALGLFDSDFADAGNAGQLDLIAALTWVKTNIGAFGGNPRNVTVCGQSGGGSKITALLVMSRASGLFQRTINMSGSSAFAMKPASDRAAVISELLKSLGLGQRDVRKLQEIPPEQLLAAHNAAAVAVKADDYRPVIDARHIAHGPLTREGLAMQASIPSIMSCTATEAATWLAGDRRNLQVTSEQVQARIGAQFGVDATKAAAVFAGYIEDDRSRTPWDVLVAVGTDALVRTPMRVAAEAKSKLGRAPVYLEEFNWRSGADGGIWGAPHAIDIPFAFGNLGKDRLTIDAGSSGLAASNNEMSAFAAFMRSGSPDNPRMPAWAPYDIVRRPTMVVGDRCQLAFDYRGGDRRAADMLPEQDAFAVVSGPLFRYMG